MEAENTLEKEETPVPDAITPVEREIPIVAPEVPEIVEQEKTKTSPAKPRGKKRKTKIPKDVTAPRQPLTGYVRYLNERRDTLRAANPRLAFAEVTRRLASEWGCLPIHEKQQYLDAAEIDRERYIQEWSAYKETEAYKNYQQLQLEQKEAMGIPGKKPRASGGPNIKADTPAGKETEGYRNFKVVQQERKAAMPVLVKRGRGLGTVARAQAESAAAGPPAVDSPAVISNGVPTNPALQLQNSTSLVTPPRPRAPITPSSTVTPPSSIMGGTDMSRGADSCQRETDIPIFTEQFLQHNKLRETELRQLRKANTDYEQQNAILQKHMENMRGAVERARNDSMTQRARTGVLKTHLTSLVERLARGLCNIPLPSGFGGATKQNMEQYMESLRVLASEQKNHPSVRQAREFLGRMDMPA